MEGRLSKSLQDKISSFDISQPYVWKLRLSEADFNQIETCVNDVVSSTGVSALSDNDNSILTIIYIAEWYKRKYQSGNRNTIIEGVDLERLWTNSGLNKKLYLYSDDNGSKRWLYSTYVLGGLAIQHELNRNDNMKFLKGLCRIYHGEDYTLENLDEASRAVAFRESIKRQYSLYEYLKEILNGEMPFDKEELADDSSDVNRFVASIKAANDEILRSKFRFEWVVTFSPDYNYMTRRLNVWLKPEEVGGGLYQYLRYDRVHLWGVCNPEKQEHLRVYIRFKLGDNIVEPSTMDQPIISYLNHGVNDFVAFGVEKGVTVKHIPANRFDKIEIVVKDDDDNEYIAQTQDATEYIQLWRVDAYSDSWTSTQNAQKETALVFSNHCHIKDESIADGVYRRRFHDRQLGTSDLWNWVYIYDSVTFIDDKGKEVSLYNRIGYDQVTTRLYADTIQYIEGGKVRHYYIEDPDISDTPDYDELPVIFGPDDIIARHFKTKDDVLNAQPDEDTDAELIEYKRDNGRFVEWTVLDEPPYGEVRLRVTIKGKLFQFSAIYLPRLDKDSAILRDFYSTLIRYRNLDKSIVVYQDNIPMDGKALCPVIPIRYGDGDDYYEIDVYRPTLIKEVMLDGKIIEYLDGEEKLNLPYIFKQRVQINDFSEHGYQAYECKNLCNIYTDVYLNIAGNPSVGMAVISAWNANTRYQAKLLDPMAPDSLVVCFGRPVNGSSWNNQEALVWNYDKDQVPSPTNPSNAIDFGIIFQNLSKNKDLTCNYPIQMDDDPWGFDDVDVSIVRCFEVANDADTYFFLVKPLVEMQKSDIIKELYVPLLESRGGKLTHKDKQGLLRLGEEFGFDWQANNIHIDND